ncbi:hypothetical protein KCP76_20495 [Salmonella enterica subsp. enterica serovar Weltevreden]|nr:hypothetical protein KCP76_20495 [Salmonella enterica subsp. enterica serovar Weltevreden]
MAQSDGRENDEVNDRVTVKTDGTRRPERGVLAVEEFSEGTMCGFAGGMPLGIWFFNESGSPGMSHFCREGGQD